MKEQKPGEAGCAQYKAIPAVKMWNDTPKKKTPSKKGFQKYIINYNFVLMRVLYVLFLLATFD